MSNKWGYGILMNGLPTESEQRAGMAAHGVPDRGEDSPAFFDLIRSGYPKRYLLTERATLLAAILPGDVIVVHGLPCAVISEADLSAFLVELVERQGTVRVVDTDIEIAPPISDAFVAQLGKDLVRAKKAIAMRLTRRKAGVTDRVGRKPKLEGKALEKARRAWFGSTRTMAEIAKEAGVSVQTLNKRFGPRNRRRTSGNE